MNQIWKDGYTPTEALDQSISVSPKVNTSKNPVPTRLILSDKELEGIAATAITFNQIANIQSQALRKRITTMLELLKREID